MKTYRLGQSEQTYNSDHTIIICENSLLEITGGAGTWAVRPCQWPLLGPPGCPPFLPDDPPQAGCPQALLELEKKTDPSSPLVSNYFSK